jgi:hypothetical protein
LVGWWWGGDPSRRVGGWVVGELTGSWVVGFVGGWLGDGFVEWRLSIRGVAGWWVDWLVGCRVRVGAVNMYGVEPTGWAGHSK